MNIPGLITKKDKAGIPFEVGRFGTGDYLTLLDMYQIFSPRPASQGLPPADPETCRGWLKGLLDAGQSFLAWRERGVIGHAVLIPDYDKRDCEFLIFVHQSHRNRGIGTALTDLAFKEAKALGLKSIWLTVETKNIRAINLYQKFGFEFCDMDPCERKMLLIL